MKASGVIRFWDLFRCCSESSINAGDRREVLVMLCTYNEVHNMPKMLDQLREHLPDADVLVVDDQSPDGTGDFVKTYAETDDRVHLLSRAGKLGLGTATRDGISWCLNQQLDGNDYQFLINLDADHSHDPAAAPKFLDCVRQDHIDVAVGSRYIPGGGLQGLRWHRRIISRCLNFYATRLLRLPITDCSGSYRCYRTASLRKLDLGKLKCKGYGFLEEILVALHRSGANFGEVPIQFETRHLGESKLGFSDIVGAIRVIHELALRLR